MAERTSERGARLSMSATYTEGCISFRLWLDVRELPRTAKNGHDLDQFRSSSIHDAKRARDDFSQFRRSAFGNHPARIGELPQPLHGCDEPSHGQVRVGRRVAGDMRA